MTLAIQNVATGHFSSASLVSGMRPERDMAGVGMRSGSDSSLLNTARGLLRCPSTGQLRRTACISDVLRPVAVWDTFLATSFRDIKAAVARFFGS